MRAHLYVWLEHSVSSFMCPGVSLDGTCVCVGVICAGFVLENRENTGISVAE